MLVIMPLTFTVITAILKISTSGLLQQMNKQNFLNTLLCMNYIQSEVNLIAEEDFTTYFMCTLGSRPYVIDVLTIFHTHINFDDAEKEMIIHKVSNNIEMKRVPYQILIELKLRSRRPKDFYDVSKLDQLRNPKK